MNSLKSESANLVLRFFFSFLTLITYPLANKIIAPSKTSAKILKKNYLLKNKIEHIYNPLNIKKIIELSNTKFIPKILNQNKHNKIIVSIGRLTWEKDYKTLIDSFDQVNLRAVYTVPGMENLSVNVAVRNLTKEDPPLSQSGEYNRLLHTDMGMQTFVGFTLEL